MTMTIPDAELEPDGGARFELGRVAVTSGALALIQLGVIYPALLLRRHAMGDWGGVDEHDRRANDTALVTGERLVSVYGPVWVITEADRSVTTILLPEEA